MGHSFGALINYHSLNSDISTGVLGDHSGRAYGFGDMTVLLNPAFEGERESTLIDAAIHHSPYPSESRGTTANRPQDESEWPSKAQMPTLVTLQSKGDWATHYAFPDHGGTLITQQWVCGIVRNSPIAMRSDEDSPVDIQS